MLALGGLGVAAGGAVVLPEGVPAAAAATAGVAAASCIIKKIGTTTFTISGEHARDMIATRTHGSRELSMTVTNRT